MTGGVTAGGFGNSEELQQRQATADAAGGVLKRLQLLRQAAIAPLGGWRAPPSQEGRAAT